MIKATWMFAIKLVGTSILCYKLLEAMIKYGIGSTVYKSFQLTPQMTLSVTYSLIAVGVLWVMSMMLINPKWGK